MKPIDWDNYRYFLALARGSNLVQAATLLHASQATVLRRVKALEQSTGTLLFTRKTSGHTLTESGKTLLGIIREAEDLFRVASERLAETNQRDRGLVRIITTELAVSAFLLPRLTDFKTKHPEITLEFDASSIVQEFQHDVNSLALRFRRPAAGDYVIKRLGLVPFGVYGAPSLLLKHRSKAKLPETMPFLIMSGSHERTSLVLWLKRLFLERDPQFSFNSFRAYLDAAHDGLGVIGIPVCVGSRDKKLRRVEIPGEDFALEAWLVRSSQSKSIKKMQTVSRFIEHAVRQALDLSELPSSPKPKRR